MAKDTKIKFLESALRHFAEKGYEGTNIRELSASLGLGKSSMYRHFESKEEIWNTVVNEMEIYYKNHFGSAENLPSIPENCDELKKMTLAMLGFTLNDEKVILTRRIIQTEQFRDERIKAIATKHFNFDIENLFAKIFKGMMDNGSVKKGDPDMLGFVYASPISMLVQLCDREPQRKDEVMKKIDAFINFFIGAYGVK